MSATNRGAERIEHDNYPTPEAAYLPMLAEFHMTAMDGRYKWLEPCAGDFRIYRQMPENNRDWAEIRNDRDYLGNDFLADIGMTNPPFSLALPIVTKMLKECRTVVVLQRLAWLESKERRPFWTANPATHLFTLSERPKFVAVCKGDKKAGIKKGCGRNYPVEYTGRCECGGKVGPGSDSAGYGWFVWDRLGVMRKPPGMYVL